MSLPIAFAILASFAAAVVNALGLFAVHRFEAWARTSRDLLLSFAAGMLLVTLAGHLLPDVASGGYGPVLIAVAGFSALALVQSGARTLGARSAYGGLLVLCAIGLHSLVDGVVYRVSFQNSDLGGLLSASALIIHEVPEAIAAYGVLRHEGVAPYRALFWAFLATGLTTPAGTMLSLLLPLHDGGLSLALGASSGALAFVVVRHLMPAIGRAGRTWTGFVLGVCVSAAILALVPHH